MTDSEIDAPPVYRQTWGIPIAQPRPSLEYQHDAVIPPLATQALADQFADLIREAHAKGARLGGNLTVQVTPEPDDPALGLMQVTARIAADDPAFLAALMEGSDQRLAPSLDGEVHPAAEEALRTDAVLHWAVAAFRQGVSRGDLLDGAILPAATDDPGGPYRERLALTGADLGMAEGIREHLSDTGAMMPTPDWLHAASDVPAFLDLVCKDLAGDLIAARDPVAPTMPPIGRVGDHVAVAGYATWDIGGQRCLRDGQGHLCMWFGTPHDGIQPGDMLYIAGEVVSTATDIPGLGPVTNLNDVERLN